MSSVLCAAENATRQRQNVRCDFLKKKWEKKAQGAVGLALEGHSLFISGKMYNFKP